VERVQPAPVMLSLRIGTPYLPNQTIKKWGVFNPEMSNVHPSCEVVVSKQTMPSAIYSFRENRDATPWEKRVYKKAHVYKQAQTNMSKHCILIHHLKITILARHAQVSVIATRCCVFTREKPSEGLTACFSVGRLLRVGDTFL